MGENRTAFPNVWSIYLDHPDEEGAVRYAAEEAVKYLSLAGISADIRSTGEALRREVFALTLSLLLGGPKGGSFRHTVMEKEIRVEAGEGNGIVYGTFALLERMGFRFLASDCDVVPETPTLPIPGIHEETPAFAGRELFWRDAMDGDFAARLKLNSARSSLTPRQGGKLRFYNFSHSFDVLVPVDRWFESHPEYFSMVDGKRLRERTQLCLTNSEVLALCVEGVGRWIQDRPDCEIFSVSMNDWYNPCQCPRCRAVDEEEGSPAGTVIRFVNAIADAYPDKYIHTFAYLYCRKPPELTRPRKNVIVRLCNIECCGSHPLGQCALERGGIDVQNGTAKNFEEAESTGTSFTEDLEQWGQICENLFIWDYTTNYANYLLPYPNLKVLAPNLRYFKAHGVKGVFEQGNFSHGACSALGQLKTCLLGRLLWNPSLDDQELTEEFTHGYYGPAAAPMLEYIHLWEGCAGENHAGIYDMPDAPYLTDELLRQAEMLLQKAAACCEGEQTDRCYSFHNGQPTDRKVFAERVDREALSVRYAILTRENPMEPGHEKRVRRFMDDAERLGISELFERKDLRASAEVLIHQRYARNRSAVPSISYPI